MVAALSTISLGLLAASGVAKLVDPHPTAGALEAARLPSHVLIVIGLAVAELAAAITGLTAGGLWLLPAAILYLGFTLFTAWALRARVPLQSCGCFGKEDTPPTAIHLAFNLVATAALAAGALADASPLPWDSGAVEIALVVVFGVVGTYLSYLILAVLPNTLAEARR